MSTFPVTLPSRLPSSNVRDGGYSVGDQNFMFAKVLVWMYGLVSAGPEFGAVSVEKEIQKKETCRDSLLWDASSNGMNG